MGINDENAEGVHCTVLKSDKYKIHKSTHIRTVTHDTMTAYLNKINDSQMKMKRVACASQQRKRLRTHKIEPHWGWGVRAHVKTNGLNIKLNVDGTAFVLFGGTKRIERVRNDRTRCVS